MRVIILILIFPIIVLGCSSGGNLVAPDDSGDILVEQKISQTSSWNWSIGLFYVSADHSTITKVENRSGDWHVNVNTFIEPPNCANCLIIDKPEVQPDGTFKVKVTLRHPFPLNPEYTGFDVRGTVIFPATRYWKRQPRIMANLVDWWIFDVFDPFYFSRAEDGGGELLNADGYTWYLFPGLDIIPHLPISRYSKGVYACGPDPDSTINGYKLFTNDPERRMFRVNESITQTYHISPPEGEFFFGYVVDASWSPPSKMPVTDPSVDFPYWANCEDGYVLELVQNAPFYTGVYDAAKPPLSVNRNVTSVTALHNMLCMPIGGGFFDTYLFAPDLTQDPILKWAGLASGTTEDVISDKIQTATQEIKQGTYDAEPGEYVALLMILMVYNDPNNPTPKQINSPPVFAFIKLQVEEGWW